MEILLPRSPLCAIVVIHVLFCVALFFFFFLIKKASTLIYKAIMPPNRYISVIITNCGCSNVKNQRSKALSSLGKATGIAERPTRYPLRMHCLVRLRKPRRWYEGNKL
jgi:hypothetical protein